MMNRRQRRSTPAVDRPVSGVDAALARLVRNQAPAAVEAMEAMQGVHAGINLAVVGLDNALVAAASVEVLHALLAPLATTRDGLQGVLRNIESAMP